MVEAFTWFIHCGYVAILCMIYFMSEFGPVMAATVSCIGLLIAFGFRFVRGEVEIWKQVRDKQDEQNKKMSETFNSIKMLKLFGWEGIFAKRIGDVRTETEVLRQEQHKIDLYGHWIGKAGW